MTEKPNEPSAGAPDSPALDTIAGAIGEPSAQAPAFPRPVGEPVRSPFDSPTEQFAATGDKVTEKLPRTDEELGLDPEVPLYSELKNSIPGAANSTTAEPSPTYSFASIPPAPSGSTEPTTKLRRRDDRRGTLDVGLLLLRLVVGGTFIYHGLQKAFGWFHGPGFDGIKTAMEHGGWKEVNLAAPMLIAGELGGGILVVLGLATPLAAGALVAVILDAWMWKEAAATGFQYKNVELESVLAGTAAVIILTGPGRLSFDRNRGWATRPFLGSFAALIAAIAAAIGVWYWLHGGNPLHGIGPWK
ncbi:DoxX family protein [Nocardia sp. NPDC020380]|uniref:DoxX family protein n=1 Tax=Nocardia sp. NPDC020380 TaxID=3364309 RepID=UPI00379377C1